MPPLSDAAVSAISEAIFAKADPQVLEAYSEFGQEPIRFKSSAQIVAYAAKQRGKPRGSVHLAVCYPDMGGRVNVKRIKLDPEKCDGFTYRFVCEGWGLIWVYLQLEGESASGSFVSANSEKRAEKWLPTYPDMEPPSVWCWTAVASHSRRLARVLKKFV